MSTFAKPNEEMTKARQTGFHMLSHTPPSREGAASKIYIKLHLPKNACLILKRSFTVEALHS